MSGTPNVDELERILNNNLGVPARGGYKRGLLIAALIKQIQLECKQAKQQACDDILGLLPDDNVVTKEFGYNSGEKKFGFRVGVAATIKAIKQYREGL